ncbi:MAG: FAD-binding oxidoreductase [Actinomycetota bacterium]
MRVVVVGSGVVGASAAYHLSRSGAEVVVVDHGHTGKATLAGAGIVCPWASGYPEGPIMDLYMAGAAAYPEIIGGVVEATGHDVGYRRVGGLVVSADEAELAEAEGRVARNSVGRLEVGGFTRITNDEARALFPPLRTGAEAIHIEGGARVDGRLLAQAFLATPGVELSTTTDPATLAIEGDRVTGVRVDGSMIAADAVVVAAGAWTAELLSSSVGAAIDVEPQKGQIMHFRVDADTGSWPVLLPVGPHYVISFDGGRVVVGATREEGSGFDTRVTAAGHAELLATVFETIPGLADATILETRVGLRPLARTAPTVGAVPGIDGLVVATGLGPIGLTVGPLFGRLAADVVFGRDSPLNLAPYAPT